MFTSCKVISLLTSIFALHLFSTYSQKQNKTKKKKRKTKTKTICSHISINVVLVLGPRTLFIHISDIVNFYIKTKVKVATFVQTSSSRMGTYCHGILVVIPPAKRFQSISSLVQVPELRDHAVVFSTALALQAELENTSMSSD